MSGEPIAITGIACRFPGAISTPRSFWEFVLSGGDAIRAVPDERKSLWGPWPVREDFPTHGGYVDEIERFDAAFFNISPREARHIDPQQRVLLELAWEALEDARIPAARLEGRPVGVYMGIFLDEYWDLQRYAAPSAIGMHTNTGGTLSIAANRISYFLDLKGPSIAVDTACSSSLTAIHLACRDIQAGTCTAALAGGANLLLAPQTTRGFERAHMLSPDGRCRAFDAGASGYGRSDGAGIVVLKSLADAVKDGDSIYAVIYGSAINQDGRSRGLTVPGQDALRAVIETAARAGGVSADQLAFVEAHGTGTPAGDPVEAMAVGRATGSSGCLIGAVKTNIGHTEAAAGVAGLIKTALSLKHGILPPSLHFVRPNPHIPFEELGLRVVTGPERLPGPCYAGVNSFGFGGANAHVVLGSPPPAGSPREAESEVYRVHGRAGTRPDGTGPLGTRPDSAEPVGDQPDGVEPVGDQPDGVEPVGIRPDGTGHVEPRDDMDRRDARIFVLSAHNTAALKQKASDLVSLLRDCPEIPPSDVSAALALQRSHLDHRLALVFEETEEAVRGLETYVAGSMPERFETARSGSHPAPVVFVFTGMGPQWYGMGQALYRADPVFREGLDAFDRLFAAISGRSIKNEMWNGATGARIADVEIAMPANMALQWALACWWRSLGMCPEFIIGHSVGEIVGACAAGALTLEEGVRIIYQRSRLQKKLQGGGEMLAVGLSPEEAKETIGPYGDSLSVAARNSPVSVTISGEAADIDRLQAQIDERRLFCRKLHTEIAYHSGQMDGIRGDFMASLNGLSPAKGEVHVLSTVTGEMTDGRHLTAEHWWRNIRSPVLFDRTFDQIPNGAAPLFLQIGPHPVLSTAIYENLAHLARTGHALASLQRDRGTWDVLLQSVAKCYVHGHDIRWDRLADRPRTPVSLPPYPWQKARYWLDGATDQTGDPPGRYPHPLIGTGIESSVDPETQVWERALSLDTHPMLADHTVLGRPIMPLAGQIEMLFETLDEVDEPVAFRDLSLSNPLIFRESGAHVVQLVRSRKRYTLSSRPESHDTGTNWLLNMRTEQVRDVEMTGSVDLEAVKSRCGRRTASRLFYERAVEMGFQYGPSFRQIDELVYSDREALAFLVSRDDGHGAFRLHPGVLDAALQALLMLVPDDDSYLPVDVETAVLHRLPGSDDVLCAYAKLRESPNAGGLRAGASGPHAGASGLRADVYLLDEKGVPVVTLGGVTLTRPGAGLSRAAAGRPSASPARPGAGRRGIKHPLGLYREEWVTAPTPENRAEGRAPSHWFVLSDDRRLGGGLAEALSRRGAKSEFVDTSCDRKAGSAGALAGKLGSVTTEPGDAAGIVGIWTGAGKRTGEGDGQSTRHTGPALESFDLIKAMLDRPELSYRLRLITAGAQSVAAGDRVTPELGTIWGCGRVAAQEHPELNCALIDLPAGTDREAGDDEQRLAEIVAMDTLAGEVAIRDGALYTRRLHPFDLDRCEAKKVPVTSNAKTSYRLSQSAPGSIEDLHFVNSEAPRPAPDEVVVRVRAAGLNFRDVLTALGMLEIPSTRPPSFGWECVGEVIARGDQVGHVDTGDLVMGMVPAAMAGYVTAKAGLVVRKPDHLGIEEAATLPVAFLTAWLGLIVRGGMSAGDRVLVHNATGGVGLAALQLARQAKAEMYATAGTDVKRTFLREMGVSHVMDSRSPDFAGEIMDWTDGKGMNIVLNTLSGPAMTASLSVLAPHGRFIEIGKTDMLGHGLVDLSLFDHNRSYHPIDLAQFIEEKPDRAGALLRKIVDMASAGEIRALPYRAYPIAEARNAFRYMSQARHTGKLVLVDDESPVPVDLGDDDPAIRPGGTYLVTGGAGGIGRYLTGWLLDRGAGLVVATGRRPGDGAVSGEETANGDEAVSGAEAAFGDGAATCEETVTGAEVATGEETAPSTGPAGKVKYVQADVTDRAAMERLITGLEAANTPVRGVFHAAGVLDDGILLTQNADRFQRVLEPKTTGAWHLHELTRDLDLDLFVLFSSAASLVGTAGQASYAAANAYLDGLADLRRKDGLPVTTINWGPWEGTGMTRDERAADRLRRQGLRAIPPDEAGALLDRILRRDVHRVGVIPTTEPAADSMLARYLAPDPGGERAPRAIPRSIPPLSKAEARALPAEKLRAHIEGYVTDAICGIVEVDPGSVDPGQTWRSLGVDSLMAVELRNRIEAGLHVSVPVETLQSATAISQTIDSLLEGLKLQGRG